MEQALIQRNFAAGELSQKMRGRDELPIYQAGAEKEVNFISETAGPARFRSGFQFVFGTRRYQPAWLWPFTFNDVDAYQMEFTTGYIRFYRNNGIVTLATQNITGVTQADPCVVTVASHGLSNGAEVIINNVAGMVQLNNRSFVIANVTTNTFSLEDNFGNQVDSTAFSAYISGGTIAPVFEVQAPFNINDVPSIKIAQNADVLYMVHHNYEPVKLTRLADNDWTVSTFSRSGNSGTDPCGPQAAITGITNANPAVVTAPNHGYSTGQLVIINGVQGMTQVNNSTGGGYFSITVLDVNTFQLNGINSTTWGTYTSGGTSVTDGPATVSNVTGVGTIAWNMSAYTATGPGDTTISGATNASPCVITDTAHGYVTGNKVTIAGVVGMTQLNGNTYTITKIDANSYSLGVDSTAYTPYVSGGTATLVVITNYFEGSQFNFDIPATATVLGVVVKISRSANVDSTPVGVTDDIVSLVVGGNIAGSNYGATSTFWPTTAAVATYGTGTTDLWGLSLTPAQINNPNFGVVIAATLVGEATPIVATIVSIQIKVYYSQPGYSMDKQQLVGAVAFYQGRLLYGYSDDYPESIWGSQPLDDNGNPQYDYFNLGTGLPADSFKFTLQPISGKVDQIHSLVPSVNFLAICTLEGISSCNGGTAGTAISPETVDVTPAVTFGCLQQISPFFLGISMLYVHRSGLIFYSFEYDIFYSAYNAMDKDLSCEQWSLSANGSGITQMVFQVSRPTVFWYTRNDGVLIGRTYMVKENVNGIHRHFIGGTNPKVLSVGITPRNNAYDQLWIVSERTIGGNTVHFVEYANDDVIFPEPDDFNTGNAAADLLTFQNAMFQAQKGYVYMDAALTYDGSQIGVTAQSELQLGGGYGVDQYTVLALPFANNLDDISFNNFQVQANGSTVYAFQLTGVSTWPLIGATYTNNGNTFTIVSPNSGNAPAGSTGIVFATSAGGGPSPSGTLTKTAGTGDNSITFTGFTAQIVQFSNTIFELEQNPGLGYSALFPNQNYITDPVYLTVPANPAFNINSEANSQWTVEGWFYFNEIFYQTIYDQSAGTNGSGGHFYIAMDISGSSPYFIIVGSNASTTVFSWGTGLVSISINTWYHLAFVRDGLNFYVYVNGVDQGATGVNYSSPVLPNFTTPVTIGAYSYPAVNDKLGAFVQEYRVSSIARYTSNFTPPQFPFIVIGPNQLLITATQSVFTAAMVGQQIWEQPVNGVNTGQGTIATFISGTQVVINVIVPFNDSGLVTLGWYLTTDTVSGIWHLNGQTVSILADGGPVAPQVVVNGQITIGFQASVIHVGLPYTGLLKTMALTPQSQAGSTVAKKKTVNRLGVKFLNTLGASYGTSLYTMQSIPFGEPSDLMNRVSPAYSGMKIVPLEDSTNEDKHIYVQQSLPLPCIVECIIPFVDFDDE